MPELTEQDTDTLRDIIRRTKLASVVFHEYGGRLHVSARDPKDDADLSLGIQHRNDDEDFGVRLVMSIEDHRGVIDVTVAGEYEVTEGDVPSGRALRLFAHEVASMALYPYAREAVDAIASRLYRESLLLPVVERGAFAIEDDDDPTADQA
ncbi:MULTISPECIES: hypothetical protein [unclassified Agrococcus]|uniref:hypothetical protein n=1 Tax=unclassified Agrococcus TaxID=2615065 RepID=UPI0036062E0A